MTEEETHEWHENELVKPPPCPQCNTAGTPIPNFREEGLEWWHCYRCSLDFSTIQQR